MQISFPENLTSFVLLVCCSVFVLSDVSLFLCLVQDSIPERGQLLSGDVNRELVSGAFSCGLAKMLGFRFICQTFDHRLGQGDWIFGWNQVPGDAVQHDFWRSANVSGDDRNSRSRRFEKNSAKGFLVGRVDQQVDLAQDFRDIFAASEEVQVICKARFFETAADRLFELDAFRLL